MRFLCRIGFHKWLPWGEPKEEGFYSPLLKAYGSETVQYTRCEHCGEIRRKVVGP